MKISVLIATHHAGAQIANTLASVRSQLHTEWEIIVVDHGPADCTEEAVRNFGFVARRAVHYEKVAETTSIAEVRNRLLELATGDAVAFLDPSDTWTQRHMGTAEQYFSEGADVIISDIRFVDRKSGRTITEQTPPSQLLTNPTRTLFARDVIGSISCVTFRRTLVDRVGAFDVQFRACESRDFLLRFALSNARIITTKRATCQRLKSGENDRSRALLFAEHTVLFHEKYRDLAAVPAALRRRLLAASLVAYGRMVRNSDHAKAALCFWRAWSLQPVQVQTLGEFALTEWHTGSGPPRSTELPSAPPVKDHSIPGDRQPAP
jgi:glycosyltransferase involved in cell wall biosynthesis